MSLGTSFQSFCKEIQFVDNKVSVSCKEITKKLNKHYYDLASEEKEHSFVVGSIGRGTAVKNTSDVDIIFQLPNSVFQKYDSYESNGQSALLQEIKTILQERYPNTDIKGDGQVVVIDFDLYTIELVPAFLQMNNTFKHPDTHDGGSWKTTDPLSEQEAAQKCDEAASGCYRNICRLIRVWKNERGLLFGGLLIDSLVYKVFCEKEFYTDCTYSDYYTILIDVFEYFSRLVADQQYWFALGSNQKVYSKNNSFIKAAKNSCEDLKKAESDSDKESTLVKLFGNTFPHENQRTYDCEIDTEEFVDNIFPVDIKFNLEIDCIVSQDGFRDFSLRKQMAMGKYTLRHNKHLSFSIIESTVPESYDIYWKVRNVGPIAVQKRMIRGQIVKTNKKVHIEHSSFQGPHFVECFIVKNGICVARDRIEVPIGSC